MLRNACELGSSDESDGLLSAETTSSGRGVKRRMSRLWLLVLVWTVAVVWFSGWLAATLPTTARLLSCPSRTPSPPPHHSPVPANTSLTSPHDYSTMVSRTQCNVNVYTPPVVDAVTVPDVIRRQSFTPAASYPHPKNATGIALMYFLISKNRFDNYLYTWNRHVLPHQRMALCLVFPDDSPIAWAKLAQELGLKRYSVEEALTESHLEDYWQGVLESMRRGDADMRLSLWRFKHGHRSKVLVQRVLPACLPVMYQRYPKMLDTERGARTCVSRTFDLQYVVGTSWYSHDMLVMASLRKLFVHFDFWLKVDNDIAFVKDLDVPLPQRMAESQSVLGVFYPEHFDPASCADTVGDCVRQFSISRGVHFTPASAGHKWFEAERFVWRSSITMGWLGFWLSQEVLDYSLFQDNWPFGHYMHRWGDQQFWSKALGLFTRSVPTTGLRYPTQSEVLWRAQGLDGDYFIHKPNPKKHPQWAAYLDEHPPPKSSQVQHDHPTHSQSETLT